MKLLLPVTLIILVSLSSGCATTPNTPSGNPEITLTDVKFDCVRIMFVNSYINQGYTIRDVSDSQIVVGRTAANAPIWYYSYYGGPPEERTTLTIYQLDTPSTLLIVTTAVYVTDPATASEKVHPAGGTQEDQDLLTSLQPIVEKHCRN